MLKQPLRSYFCHDAFTVNSCRSYVQTFFRAAIRIGYLGSFLLFAACDYKKTNGVNPIPNTQAISKIFFTQNTVDAKSGKSITVPKTFLCGWASETEAGRDAEHLTNNAMIPDHCNLVFEITEQSLVGKIINPSFPADPSRWEIALTIPIKKHYYIENQKDDKGRDTNNVIENSSRSHWSARPYIDLDLAGIQFDFNWSSNFPEEMIRFMKATPGTVSVEDIEWDFGNGFLGFTITKGSWGGSNNKFRVNFLAFDTNPKFKKTPFNDKNYKKMNVLHIIGEKVDGLYSILHAAHWDLSKTHKIKLWGFPKEYADVAENVVKDWNDTFQKIDAVPKGHSPFVVDRTPAKHAFDLRYPTIAWISDKKVSSYSPLGIGMALADVKNGEIKWAMITLYGGMIESYINSYNPIGSSSSSSQKIASNLFNAKDFSEKFDLPTVLKQISNNPRVSKIDLESDLGRINGKLKEMAAAKNPNKKLKDTEVPKISSEFLQDIYSQMALTSQKMTDEARQQVPGKTYSQLIQKMLTPGHKLESEESQAKQALLGALKSNEDLSIRDKLTKKYSGSILDTERRFIDVAADWAAARAQLGSSDLASDKKILLKIIKELITHEYGHIMGLGHQFKENILPDPHTVPPGIYKALAAKATTEKGFTNFTSVMGYRNPRSEIAEEDDVKPGPQDELVLNYLYNQKFATYRQGDANFTFFDIPESGIIPLELRDKPEYKVSYFPQCNDLEASLSFDPYCNRFDRGYNATTIIQNYFSDLKDNLIPTLFAFTEARGGNPEYNENYLWMKSLSTMGRTRLFYDYMRMTYKNDIDQIRNDEDALFEFSRGCQQENPSNAKLAEIFKRRPHLKELCQANALVLSEYKALVSRNLVDFTKKNLEGRFMPGGMSGGDVDRDWSRFGGNWTELTGLPLKLSALYALNTGVPWMTEFGMYGVPIYDDPNYKFSYSHLYPHEYTEIVASNVRNNLRFASLGQGERTNMGASVLAMSWLNSMAEYGNNDAGLFPDQYNSKIRNQQRFDLGFVAIIMKGRKKENNPGYVESFDGVVFDFNTNKETALTNAFLLPGAEVFANASQMFLFPVTRFIPYSDTEGYAFAFKLDYFPDHTNPLDKISVKTDLSELHNELIKACVTGSEGHSNGLSQFFNGTTEFKGFKMDPGLARMESKRKDFLDSIQEAFDLYYQSDKFTQKPKPETCRESLRGLGLIITSAAVINGYWLPQLMDYIQK